MEKKGIVIAVLIAAAVAVTAVVIVNRNSVVKVSAVEVVGTSVSQEDTAVTAEVGKKGEAESASDVSNARLQTVAEIKQETETASGQGAVGEQSGSEVVVAGAAGATEASVVVAKDGEVPSEDGEIKETGLPVETDIPEDWDWKTFPTRAPGKDDSANGGSSSGNDNTEKSGESESSTTEGEPEGQSAEESSQSDEEESTKEDVTEKSGEETSPAESSSEEEGSTEETEPETTTLSPEEQASIVESATAPIELPPIFFN